MIGWTIVEVPSGLGLRPPAPGVEPGTADAPAALRVAGLHDRLAAAGAREAEPVLPAAYDPAVVVGRLRNEDAIVDLSRRLARRIDGVLDAGRRPLVLGGDCGILVGVGLALRRRSAVHGEHVALVHIDGHSDFRHPGNSDDCASLAGEDLAAAVGIHWPGIADLDGLGPYFDAATTVQLGCRDDDEELDEIRRTLGLVIPASEVQRDGVTTTTERVLDVTADSAGIWLHVDVDVLDPSVISAVDSPDAGGLAVHELVDLLQRLLPRAVGIQFTVFDPTLDPDGAQAAVLAATIAASTLVG